MLASTITPGSSDHNYQYYLFRASINASSHTVPSQTWIFLVPIFSLETIQMLEPWKGACLFENVLRGMEAKNMINALARDITP